MCSLGAGCDTFFVEFDGSTGNNGGITCTYIPHVALKSFNLIDFVNFVDDESKEMYVLQCSQSFEETFVDNSDPFTSVEKTAQLDGPLLGFQYMRKMVCGDTWEYEVEKEVTSAMLEARGITPDYITKIQPIAFVRSAVGTATGNSETCPSSKIINILICIPTE